jgi:hypothetical protein
MDRRRPKLSVHRVMKSRGGGEGTMAKHAGRENWEDYMEWILDIRVCRNTIARRQHNSRAVTNVNGNAPN